MSTTDEPQMMAVLVRLPRDGAPQPLYAPEGYGRYVGSAPASVPQLRSVGPDSLIEQHPALVVLWERSP